MPLLMIFLMSMVPLIEQRGAIPLGILVYHMDPLIVFLVSFLGSLVPAPLILLLFNFIYNWMKTVKAFNWLTSFIQRKLEKNSPKLEKYKEIGLITFIAIPLPTTGLWTGSAVAAFLRLDFKKSMICCMIGGFLSALAITGICLLFPALFS